MATIVLLRIYSFEMGYYEDPDHVVYITPYSFNEISWDTATKQITVQSGGGSYSQYPGSTEGPPANVSYPTDVLVEEYVVPSTTTAIGYISGEEGKLRQIYHDGDGGIISQYQCTLAFVSATPVAPATGQTTGSVQIQISGGKSPIRVRVGTTGIYQTMPANGLLEITGISPGNYRVRAEDSSTPICWAETDVQVATAGGQTCTLAITSAQGLEPAAGTLLGSIELLVSGGVVPVSVRLGSTANYSPITAGKIVLNGLTPGTYLVEVKDSSSPACIAQETVVVPNRPENQFSFLPWVRHRLASMASTTTQSMRPTVALRLTTNVIRTTGASSLVVDKTVELHGPGDITGLLPEAIVRTIPAADELQYSPSLLAAIEFKDEDLPWRYSLASPTNDRVAPWCFLLTVEESEFHALEQGTSILPRIEVLRSLLPVDEEAEWPWAHVQVNQPLQVHTTDQFPKRDDFLNGALQQDPSLAFSRILSRRHHRANTRYWAFLLPLYELGRQAGLGLATSVTDSKLLAGANLTEEWVDFPVYYQWSFTTGAGGDFETLARRIRPVRVENPGLQLAVDPVLRPTEAGNSVTELLAMPGVLEVERTGTSVPSLATMQALYDAIVPSPNTQTNTLDARPIVPPPLYGTSYLTDYTLANPSRQKVLGTLPARWVEQVNLDPRYRVFASIGAQIVQEKQDEYVQQAWAQVGDVLTANANLRALQGSLLTLQGLRDKHLPSTTSVGSASLQTSLVANATSTASLENYGLHLTAPILDRTKVGDLTAKEIIRRSSMPLAAFSPTFRRIVRPYGPYQIGQAGLPRRSTQTEQDSSATSLQERDSLLSLIADEAITAAPRKERKMRAYQVDDEQLQDVLDTTEPTSLQILRADGEGYDSVTTSTTLTLLTQAYTDFVTASADTPALISFTDTDPQKPPLDLSVLKQGILEAADPEKVIVKQTTQRIDTTPAVSEGDFSGSDFVEADFLTTNATPALSGATNSNSFLVAAATNVKTPPIKPLMAYPVFNMPMSEPLRQKYPQFLLPGLEQLPVNTATLVNVNRRVLEAYMVGANHAMGSELQWRGFPTDLRGSYFRQFWNNTDIINTNATTATDRAEVQENFRDILPLHEWGTTALGAHEPEAAESPSLWLVLRTELLQRHPQTIVCAQPAQPASSSAGFTWRPDSSTTIYPITRLAISQDIVALGFALSLDEVLGSNTEDDGGYFFVFQERPGEPLFGLDETSTVTPPESWNDVSWENFDAAAGEILSATSLATLELTNDDSVTQITTSAKAAYAFLRQPVIVAIHAQDLLPPQIFTL